MSDPIGYDLYVRDDRMYQPPPPPSPQPFAAPDPVYTELPGSGSGGGPAIPSLFNRAYKLDMPQPIGPYVSAPVVSPTPTITPETGVPNLKAPTSPLLAQASPGQPFLAPAPRSGTNPKAAPKTTGSVRLTPDQRRNLGAYLNLLTRSIGRPLAAAKEASPIRLTAEEQRNFNAWLTKNLGPGLSPAFPEEPSGDAVRVVNKILQNPQLSERLKKVWIANPNARVSDDPAIASLRASTRKDVDDLIDAAELYGLATGGRALVKGTVTTGLEAFQTGRALLETARGNLANLTATGARDQAMQRISGIRDAFGTAGDGLDSLLGGVRTARPATTAAQSPAATAGSARLLASLSSKALRSIDYTEEQTVNLSKVGTGFGLYYFAAKATRGEVAMAYSDAVPGLPINVTSLFNEASQSNSVAGAQRTLVFYTTKPGSKTEADGFFVATANGSAASSKLFNVSKISKDIQAGKLSNPLDYFDLGKINLIAQSLQNPDPTKNKKQLGGGARVTAAQLASVSAGVFFGTRELNARIKLNVNLASLNGTVRAMKILQGGKGPGGGMVSANGLLQAYANLYSVLPSAKDPLTGRAVPKAPEKRGLQYSIQYQLGGPVGTSVYVVETQPSKIEANLFLKARDANGNVKPVFGQLVPLSPASTVKALSFTFNGNKYTAIYDPQLKMDRVFKGQAADALKDYSSQQWSEGTRLLEAVRHAFLDPLPPNSIGFRLQSR
jgi:hypothetical protein